MQPRLTRSRTDVMVAGVCGGLGEYFAVDPVLVRLIFVLVTLTSGLGIPVYLVMWLVMPKASVLPGGQPAPGFDANEFGRQMGQIGQQIGQEAAQIGRELHEAVKAHARVDARQRPGVGTMGQPPEPSEYNFDPQTGRPLRESKPSTGQTINLGDPQQLPIQQRVQSSQQPQGVPQTAQPQRQGRNWRTLGFIMIGIGGLIFLNQIQALLGFDLDIVFPIVLIVAGVVLLRRRS